MVTDQSVVMIVVHLVTVQQVVHTEIATHAHLPIVANAAMVHATPAQVQIVRHVRMVIAIHVRHHGHLQIVQQAVHTETEIHVHHHVQVQIVEIVAQVPIVHAETTHSVAIAQRQAMIAVPQVALTVHETIVHHAMTAVAHVTANAVVVQIVPEVASPMIAKNVHAAALAKSA
jgi:hypothetical protein